MAVTQHDDVAHLNIAYSKIQSRAGTMIAATEFKGRNDIRDVPHDEDVVRPSIEDRLQ
jgi:hypothetical protein